MAINTILLDLSVDPVKISEDIDLRSTIEEVLSKFIPELKEAHVKKLGGGGFLSTYTAARDCFVTVRGFPKGLVAINIEYYLRDGDEALLSFEAVRRLEGALTERSGSTKSHKYPALKRGGGPDRYFVTRDERIIEYDIDAVVFEERSQYQTVEIFHSKSLGNLLVLDGIPNLSDRDLIYTETLMQRGEEDYSNKEIVVLGGGDGALLFELLKERPQFVTVLESDEVVLRACRKHLRACCGDALDRLEGPNHKIVIGNCVEALDAMIAEGKRVDYVFGDLTDVPLSTFPRGEQERWDFVRLVLDKAMRILKPTGKYMTHGDGAARPAALAKYEEALKNLKVPVQYTRKTAFIPSFVEDWVFYQVWPKREVNAKHLFVQCDKPVSVKTMLIVE